MANVDLFTLLDLVASQAREYLPTVMKQGRINHLVHIGYDPESGQFNFQFIDGRILSGTRGTLLEEFGQARWALP